MTTTAFSLSFRHDSLTTASKSTLERMAKTLGFTQNQTVLYALARLRDDLKLSEAEPVVATDGAELEYPSLTTQQLEIIRAQAPRRNAKPVRSTSIVDRL